MRIDVLSASQVRVWPVMTKNLILCLLLTAITGTPLPALETPWPGIAANLIKAGLVIDGSDPAPADAATTGAAPDVAAPAAAAPDVATPAVATPDQSQPCAGVSFTRNLKYGDSDQNVLDIATGDSNKTSPRPVLVFVVGESFAAGATDAAGPLRDEVMCFAARHGMVGVKVNYRLAPANPWPAGAKDVAAAISWVHENIDLFGGSGEEIVAVGYSVGAFHVASLLAHPEFQERDSGLAAAILVSGIYRPSADASANEKSYFGADTSKYNERSAFPGILNIETPILLAWSALDPPRLVEQGKKLKELLCNSPTHCPHTAVLKNKDGLASAFGFNDSGGSLAEPTLELVREIETRGLP
jgi:acetyl esterase/lipase